MALSMASGDRKRPPISAVAMLSNSDEIFSEIFQAVLQDQLHFHRVIMVQTFQDVLRHPVVHEPISLALFDREMPGLDNFRSFPVLRKHLGAARLAIASSSAEKRDIILALESGAHGYLLKTMNLAEIKRALELVINGGIFVPAGLADLD